MTDALTDMFLGHLCPIDEYRVYGYMTSTRLKLLAVLEDVNDIRESDLKKVSIPCCRKFCSKAPSKTKPNLDSMTVCVMRRRGCSVEGAGAGYDNSNLGYAPR